MIINSSGLEDLVVFDSSGLRIGLPYFPDAEFFRHVVIGAKAYAEGQQKGCGPTKEEEDSWKVVLSDIEKEIIHEIFFVRECITNTIGRLHKIKDHSDNPNSTILRGLFLRLQISFKVSFVPIRRGFLFEGATLLRLILEQIILGYHLFKKNPTLEELFRIRPQNIISELKEIFPDSEEVYELLSEKSHLMPEEFSDFFETSSNELTLKFALERNALQLTQYLLLLNDYLLSIFEVINYDELRQHFCISKCDGTFNLIQDRATLTRLTDFRTKYKF
ncbi:MAG TPA: hypothetical protein PKM25_12360 [Candidatus Ozemobacteraceae bacterium]|nr:hypothetical protein [Candidatus Ozemobacteraceae bacterium]